MPKAAPVARASTSINIDKDLWKRFKMRCAGDGNTVTEQMETLIGNFLNTHRVKTTKSTTRR